MADIAHIAGLVVTGLHPSPIPHTDFTTTTTHKTLRGPRAGLILCRKKYAEAIDKTVFPGIQGGPLMHVVAAKAIALKLAMAEEFKVYQSQVVKNAKVLSETLAEEGFRLVAGGTDTHLFLVDLSTKNITGAKAQEALDEVGITVNKNNIPFDMKSPVVTSGIRVGTPAVTTRGMKEEEMNEIGKLMAKVLHNIGNVHVYQEAREQVKDLCNRFVLYPELEHD